MVGDVRTKVNRHQGPLQSILLEAPPANPATVRSTKIWTTLAPSQLLHYHLRLWASSCVLFDLDFVGSTHIAAIGLIDRHKVAFVALSRLLPRPVATASTNSITTIAASASRLVAIEWLMRRSIYNQTNSSLSSHSSHTLSSSLC